MASSMRATVGLLLRDIVSSQADMEKLEKKSLEELDQMVYQEMMKALQFGRSQSQALASLRNKLGRLSQDLVLASESKERVQRHLLEECKSRRREREELRKSTLELEAEKDCFIRETMALRERNRLLEAELRAKELEAKRLAESNLNIEENAVRAYKRTRFEEDADKRAVWRMKPVLRKTYYELRKVCRAQPLRSVPIFDLLFQHRDGQSSLREDEERDEEIDSPDSDEGWPCDDNDHALLEDGVLKAKVDGAGDTISTPAAIERSSLVIDPKKPSRLVGRRDLGI